MNKLKNLINDKLFSRILKNSGIILCGNSIATLLNLVSFTIVARQLGPQLLAILVLSQTYSLIINDIFNIQTWESMIKFGSKCLYRESNTSIIQTNLFLDIISAFAAFLFSLLLIKPTMILLGWDTVNTNYYLLYTISILFNITTLTIGIPRLFDRFLVIAKIQIATSFLKVSLVILSIYYFNTIISYLLIYLFSGILTNILLMAYSLLILKRELGRGWWRKKIKIDFDQVKFIWWTNLRTIIRIPVQHFDMIVISTVLSIQMVGIYKVYKEIAGVLSRIGDPVNQAIYPEFTKLIGENKTKTSSDLTKKSILLLLVFGLIIAAIMILSAKYMVLKFFGSEYLQNIDILYTMIVLFCISFITVPINSLFIAAGFAKYSFFIVLFTNIIYLVTAFTLGKNIGIYGVVIAYAIQLFLNKILKLYYLRKYSTDWSISVR